MVLACLPQQFHSVFCFVFFSLHFGKNFKNQADIYIDEGGSVLGNGAYSNDEGKTGNTFAAAKKEADKEDTRKDNSNGKTLLLKTKARNIMVNKDDIMYVESRRRKKEIHMTDGVIEIYSTMNELKRQLGDGFYQCHRGYIVNMAYVKEYTCDSITISSGEFVYMSKEKYNGFENSYTLYLKNV